MYMIYILGSEDLSDEARDAHRYIDSSDSASSRHHTSGIDLLIINLEIPDHKIFCVYPTN